MWRAAFAIKVLVTAAVLAWLATKLNFSLVLARLGDSNVSMLVAGTLILALQPPLGAARWQLILRSMGVKLPNSAVTQWTYVGVFFSQVLPASVGGDALRIWLTVRAGAELKDAVNSIMLDRVAMLLSLLVFLALSAPWLRHLLPSSPLWLLESAILLGCVAAIATLLAGGKLPARFLQTRMGQWVGALSDATRSLVDRPKFGVGTVLLSLAGIFNLLVAVMIFAIAFGAKASVFSILVLLPPVIIVSVLPISIGGWGTREVAMVAALGTVGVPSEAALLASVWLGLGSILIALPGAFFHFFLAVPVKPAEPVQKLMQEPQSHGPA